MEKKHLDIRLKQMQDEGTRFRAGVNIGVDISWDELRARYDAVVIATGAMVPRDLPIPGRDLAGVHFAMEYLVQANRVGAGDTVADRSLFTAHETFRLLIFSLHSPPCDLNRNCSASFLQYVPISR